MWGDWNDQLGRVDVVPTIVGDKKKGTTPRSEVVPFGGSGVNRLDYGDIGRGGAFGTLHDLERNPVAIVERLETAGIDPRVVNKHIRAVCSFDEAVTLTCVEPFDCSVHDNILLSIKFRDFMLEDVTAGNVSFLQNEIAPPKFGQGRVDGHQYRTLPAKRNSLFMSTPFFFFDGPF